MLGRGNSLRLGGGRVFSARREKNQQRVAAYLHAQILLLAQGELDEPGVHDNDNPEYGVAPVGPLLPSHPQDLLIWRLFGQRFGTRGSSPGEVF